MARTESAAQQAANADALRAALAALERQLGQASSDHRFREVAQALSGKVEAALAAGRPAADWERSGGWFLSPTRMAESALPDEEPLALALVDMCHAAARWRASLQG